MERQNKPWNIVTVLVVFISSSFLATVDYDFNSKSSIKDVKTTFFFIFVSFTKTLTAGVCMDLWICENLEVWSFIEDKP